MRQRVLPTIVVAAVMVSLAAGLAAPVPQPLPAMALGAVLVWRVEVAAVLFTAAYGAIITVSTR